MSWPRAVALRTERLSLEPLTVEHASEMVSALAPRALYRFTGGEPPTPSELEARYRRQSRGRSDDGRAGWSNWIIRPVDGGAAVGFVQATLTVDGPDLVADLAWVVTPSEQGRGVASEAAAAVVTWLSLNGVGRLQASIHPDNTASERVARRLGLAPTSLLVDDEVVWGADVGAVADGASASTR